MSKKALCLLFVLLGIMAAGSQKTYAASLTSLSDTISTSRPSASAPLSSDQSAGVGQVSIVDNNAVFLQSDSVTAWADPAGGGETTNTGLLVASMSAANTPSAGQRTVYFTNTIGNTHHKGDAFVAPITAMHTVSFKPVTTVPVGGKIIISFPTLASTDTNAASPSAQAFQLNGLSTSNIQANFSSGSSTCTFAVSGTSAGQTPAITCTVGTAGITGGVTVTILIGCSAHSGAACTTQVPTLINPMKSPGNALSGQGAATTQNDNWKISVQTQDTPGAGGTVLDSGTAVVGTIESVQVQANIDPTLTFQITGTSNGTTINNAYVSGCPNSSSDVTNSGLATNATFVNLGTVSTNLNVAAQKMTVSTNASSGYALTATASGHLTNSPGTHSITDNTTPAAITAGTEFFGIHPCGTDVANASTVWNNGGNGTQTSLTSGTGFVGWPTPTTSLVLASRTGVANQIATAVEYAITASAVTPAGLYTAIITYVATPTFN